VNAASPQLSLPQALERVVSSLQQGDLADAERICRLVLAADPAQVDALHLLGVTLLRGGRAEEALEPLARARNLDLGFADAAYNHAVALGELGRWHDALTAYDHVVGLDPKNARAWNNRGNVLQKLERWEEALAAYERTLALRPDHADAWHNRGVVLMSLGRPREALAALERAVALAPRHGEAQWTRSLAHLLLGEYEPGWRLHEWRWQTEQMAHLARGFREPLWLGGEPLAGRTILLHADQGFGDTIQMTRYVPLVAALGGHVVLEVHAHLARLMAMLGPGIEVVARGAPLPRFDVQCPLGSLPLALRTTLDTIPSPQGYLRPDPGDVARWGQVLGREAARAWASPGRAMRGTAATASAASPFAEIAPLLDARFEWHALQTEFRPGEHAAAEAAGVRLWRERLGDFADSAALAAHLDRVITVDTSIAHLAGAVGLPAWILVTWTPDYRWMLERPDSPWYASARLFRQPRALDWGSALDDMRRALDALPAAR
jgi:tetratricopeptide (TPR) repeat protein